MQSTFYASLLTKVKTLDTPKFRKKEGYKQEIIDVPEKFQFQLWFGGQKFEVFPDDNILNHYLNKAKLIISCINNRDPDTDSVDFDPCRKFDCEFKHKEFSIYKPKFKQIKQ